MILMQPVDNYQPIRMINNTLKYINNHLDMNPIIGVVLGSGLDQLATYLENKVIIKYSDIPSFIDTTIDGHEGEFIIGNISGSKQKIIFANGRFHYYEGLSYDKVHIIIDIFHGLGCKDVIITNSSGCLIPQWSPGDIMIIDSHIDFTCRYSPTKIEKKGGVEYYNPKLKDIAIKSMENMEIPTRIGTYGWTLGPTYETAAEIDYMESLHISAVGMSTVPEIERAHELNINLLAIACLTNYAAGISSEPLTHEEVVAQAKKSSSTFCELLNKILNKIS